MRTLYLMICPSAPRLTFRMALQPMTLRLTGRGDEGVGAGLGERCHLGVHSHLPLGGVSASERLGEAAGFIRYLYTESKASCLAWWWWCAEGRGSSIPNAGDHMIAQLPHRSRQLRAGRTSRIGHVIVIVVVIVFVFAAVVRLRIGIEIGDGRRWGNECWSGPPVPTQRGRRCSQRWPHPR